MIFRLTFWSTRHSLKSNLVISRLAQRSGLLSLKFDANSNPITTVYLKRNRALQNLDLFATCQNLLMQHIYATLLVLTQACRNQIQTSRKSNLLNFGNIYLFKVNKKITRKRCEICSMLTIKTPERRQWRMSMLWTYFTPFFSVSFVEFEQVTACWD